MEQANSKIHHGRNISRVRRSKDMKQHVLGDLVGISQQVISEYEKKPVISDKMLQKFAKALECPVELFKEMEDDPLKIIIENNNIENNNIENNNGAAGYIAGDSIVNNNPIQQLVDLFKKSLEKENKIIDLLEKLLEEKK